MVCCVVQPGARVVQSARAVLPTVADQASALQLTTSSQQLGAALGDLRSALNRAREVCTGLELDSASELIRSLKAELEAFQKSAERAGLRPLPGETVSVAMRH
jgi:talin